MEHFLQPASKKSRMLSLVNSETDSSWNCLSCSFLNHKDLLICEICERPKNFRKEVKMPNPTCESDDSVYVDGIVDLLNYYTPFERFVLCAPPPFHFTQRNLYGKRWSCGYRNIQMLCSSLMQRPDFRNALFSRDGKIPGIRSIQEWIERAWRDGFDPEGAFQFKNKLVDKSVWIGATECAALLRYFGLRAIIVDFVSVQGPVSVMQQVSEFLGRYFQLSSTPHPAPLPLYFQHMGHSRTIIGVQTDSGSHLSANVKSLLLFDPGCCGESLKSNLINRNNKWRQQVLRGINALKEPSYQIVYIAEGIMTAEERNNSKVLIGERYNSPLKNIV